MSVRIKVDISDLHRLQANLTSDPEVAELTDKLATVTERQTQERFSRRREPSGKRWEPRKVPASHPPLELTGRLRRSIEAQGDAKGGDIGVELRAPVPYGQIIQRNRPFLGWGKRDQSELAETAERFLARSVLR